MNLRLLLLSALFFLLICSLALALQLPKGILKIQEANNELAQNFLQNVSFFIAFLAGMTSLLSPCILPFLPAYFAITFKQKRRITLATLLFFLGFSIVFIVMGLIAALTGTALVEVFKSWSLIIIIAGLLFVLLGVMTMLGKSFSGPSFAKRFGDDALGIFMSGIAFAIGWSACTGPLLSGVLLMTATFHNYATASVLMLGYALGIFLPLFVLSFFYDKLGVDRLKWLNKEVVLSFSRRKFMTTVPKIISGALFIFLGILFIFLEGTSEINSFDMFGLRKYFYELQNSALAHISASNVIGAAILVVFIAVLGYFAFKQLRSSNKNKG